MKGQWLPQKLRRLAGRNGRGSKSLSAIARKYAGTGDDNLSGKSESSPRYKSALTLKKKFSEVINGKRNTKSLIHILETEWSLSISEIREIFAEHQERVSAGNLFSEEELKNWYRIHYAGQIAIAEGRTVTEVLLEQNELRKLWE